MVNYYGILENLSWNKTIEEQQEAIQYILKHKEFNSELLIQPLSDKSCWENAAKILVQRDFDEKIILYLFGWLQDINWPGAKIIREFLNTLSKDKFLPYYEISIKRAIELNDESWLEFLSYYVFNNKVNRDDFNDKNLYDELLKYID